MKKYNLRNIMKRAWQLVRTIGMTISAGLRQSWREAKSEKSERIYIKDWFVGKILSQNFQPAAFLIDVVGIVKETEKAYLLRVEVGYSSDLEECTDVWCPKSCTMTETEKEIAEQAQQERFDKACAAYDKLVEFAKANNVKGVRKGMRKATIMAKIEAAGLEYIA